MIERDRQHRALIQILEQNRQHDQIIILDQKLTTVLALEPDHLRQREEKIIILQVIGRRPEVDHQQVIPDHLLLQEVVPECDLHQVDQVLKDEAEKCRTIQFNN
jgi:hypothetical protein